MPQLRSSPDAGGIYIHVPFCLRKCPYCDFYSISDRSRLPAFLDALRTEIRLTGGHGLSVDSLYLGGGTPSLLAPAQAADILSAARQGFRVSGTAEITLEVNPGTADFERLKGYREAGINRINIGVQSFSDRNLSFLGRIHSADDARRSIEWARQAGFDNIGVDLIYGLPGQRPAGWAEDLYQAVALRPEHLSCYSLTYESGTPLDRLRRQGRVHPLPDARVGELFLTAISVLAEGGYTQYEISNFALSSARRSRHNRKYWNFAPYIGLGPSAHSYLPPRRRWNRADVDAYIADLQHGKLAVEGEEALTQPQQMIEAVYLGLRQTEGIALEDFEKRFGETFRKVFAAGLNGLTQDGLVRIDSRCCTLSTEGMLFLDTVAARLVADLE